MKKMFLTGIGFLLAMNLTWAQQYTPEETAAQTTTELVQKLNLNDEQKTAIGSILLDHAKAEDAVFKDEGASAEAKSESLSKLQSTTDAKISEILTDDQKTIYQTVITERPLKTIPEKKDTKEKNEETE